MKTPVVIRKVPKVRHIYLQKSILQKSKNISTEKTIRYLE